ncbi:MAG: Spy/CpxP family protein refolding chaperone [candidate division KSB1 bacterium]|nr:Spy/CpxP family protein refolding chaperone [candidate division KSB1 bacterium]
MKRISLFLTAIIAGVILFASLASAQPRGKTMQRGERVGKQWAEELGLTSEQKEQINQILLATRKKNIDVQAKQKLAHLELQELLAADAPDQNKINAKIAELSKIHETLMRNRIESLLSVQKVLTPEQRKKAKELRPFGGFHGGLGRWDGGPGLGLRGRFGPPTDLELPPLDEL